MIHSVEEMIEQYLNAWNSATAEQYEPAFTPCWDIKGTYSDPNFSLVEGLSGLVGIAKESLITLGSRTFSIVRPVQAHDNTCFYIWKVTFPNGETKEGYDFIEYNHDFKITRLVSYY